MNTKIQPGKPPIKPNKEYIPDRFAFHGAQLCKALAEQAEGLAGDCERIVSICKKYMALPEEMVEKEVREYSQKAKAVRRNLKALSVKARLTELALSTTPRTSEEWLAAAEKGEVLNVFCDEGLNAIAVQAVNATRFVLGTYNKLERMLERG